MWIVRTAGGKMPRLHRIGHIKSPRLPTSENRSHRVSWCRQNVIYQGNFGRRQNAKEDLYFSSLCSNSWTTNSLNVIHPVSDGCHITLPSYLTIAFINSLLQIFHLSDVRNDVLSIYCLFIKLFQLMHERRTLFFVLAFPQNSFAEWADCRQYGLRSASAFIFMFDLTRADSFTHIKMLRDQVNIEIWVAYTVDF